MAVKSGRTHSSISATRDAEPNADFPAKDFEYGAALPRRQLWPYHPSSVSNEGEDSPMVRSIALLALFTCQVATAQDGLFEDPLNAEALTDTPPMTDPGVLVPAAKKETTPAARSEDWKPKLAITLTTSPEGVGATRQVVRRVPVYSTAYEEADVVRGDKTVKVKVPVQKLTWREVTESISVPGSAQVLCDELTLTMEASDSGPRYSFKSNGPLILQTQGTRIQADSGSYLDGKLKLINAKVQQGGMTMESDTLTIAMMVYGVSTVTNHPSPNAYAPMVPIPDANFDRDRALDSRQPIDRSTYDDWNPQESQPADSAPSREPDRESNFRRSPN